MPSRLPKAKHWKRGTRWLLLALALLIVGGVSFGGWRLIRGSKAAPVGLLFHTVKRETLQITITERGSIESAENNEISCQVKAKAPNAPATSIRWVIDNGSIVKKGDKLMDLDDSVLQDQLTTQQIATEKAKGDWLQAEEVYKVQVSTAQGAVETARTNLEVAKITLAEYLEGLYQQSNVDLENKVTLAHSDLAMWEERAAWSERMSRPGRQYVTSSQAEADQARLLSARLTVKNMETQFDVLKRLTKEKNRTDFQGKIDEADRAVKRAELAFKATEVQYDVDRRTKQMNYDKEAVRLRDIEKEIEKCYIKAPQSGMVVYYVEERARWSAAPTMIAQGESVKEGQKLMSIPNLNRMVVNARVHEAMVSRVKADVSVDTGFSEAVNTVLLLTPSPLVDLTTYTAFEMDLQQPFSSAHRRQQRKILSRGMDATVRVNAFPDRLLKGHVKSVATVASQADLFGSDVKVYQTFVSIDESMEGLRPGMDAQITIHVDSQPEPVLAIPLQAVLGTVDMGEKRRCFVNSDGGTELREITLGMTNEKMVEVKEGLHEGDVIVLNPVLLLSEKERQEYGNLPAAGQGSYGGQKGKGGPGNGKGKGKGRGGPGAGAPGAGGPGAGGPGAGGPGGAAAPGAGMRGGAPGTAPGGAGAPPGGGAGMRGGAPRSQ